MVDLTIPMLIFIIVAVAAIGACIWFFVHNLRKYHYQGNTYLYLIPLGLVCYAASLIVNLDAGIAHPAVSVFSSIFDAVKMVIAAFERDAISNYFAVPWTSIEFYFGIIYILSSVVSFAFLSMATILFVGRILLNGLGRNSRRFSKDSNIHYIFTDSKVTVSVRLALELIKDKEGEPRNAVTVFVSRSSLKTQEGTEFKDSLIQLGIQVKAENFSKNLASKIIKQYLPKYFKKNKKKRFTRNVFIYCMFSDDDTSTKVANNFEEGLNDNSTFTALREKNNLYEQEKIEEGLTKDELDGLEKFRVYITYQDNDIDLIHNYSKNTLHIINTLSQYDMVSSEFMLENPITRFIDLKTIKSVADQDNKSMHVTFFGLGMINRPIFEKMTHAYQLWGDNINKINYHILDRDGVQLAENCQNMYTNPKGQVFLYSVDHDCDGEDLFEYEVIDRFVKRIKDQENRFNAAGFELFIISLKNTNSDLRVAKNLKKALLKYVDKEKLKKTVIFLRIGEEDVANRLIENDSDFMKQNEIDLTSENYQGYAPLVAYGENALMPKFISQHYAEIIKTGIISSYAYKVKDKKTFDLTENDPGFLDVRRNWLTNDKTGFIKNIFVAFGLETKKVLLGCKKLEDVKTIFDNKEEKRYTDYKLETDKLIQLANLEHNRWMATNYLMDKAAPLDNDLTNFPNFLKENTNYLSDKSNPDFKFMTKINNGTRHVCMLTNNGLRELYTFCKNHNLKDEGFKLVFLNDINPIQKYFEIYYGDNKQ